MIVERIEEITGELFIGNDEIGFVNAQEMCEDLNISGESISDITEENILMYLQMCNGGQPII